VEFNVFFFFRISEIRLRVALQR